MLRHADIWTAIDRLAQEQGLTTSGLARRAGLDPTTFNKSKRITRNGKARWPSTESIAKILEATGATLGEFLACFDPQIEGHRRLPLVGSDDLAAASCLDGSGGLAAGDWEEISFPEAGLSAFAVEVVGHELEPAYRRGDVLIVAPGSQIRRGDRLLLRTQCGVLMARELVRRTVTRLSLRQPFGLDRPQAVAVDQIAWMARILWASQ